MTFKSVGICAFYRYQELTTILADDGVYLGMVTQKCLTRFLQIQRVALGGK